MTSPGAERQLRTIARRQHGVFLLRQAVEVGFTRPVIRRRLERRIWEPPPDQWTGQLLVGVTLVTNGVASGRSAGALYGLLSAPTQLEVIARRTSRLVLPAVVHTSNALAKGDVTTVDGISTTSPVRTIIDLGGCLPAVIFEDLFDTAIVQRLVTVERLEARAMELWAPRRNGRATVLELWARRQPGLADARNLWEAKVLRVVRDLGLPDARVNHRVQVGGKRRYIDLAWPEAKVAVEFDGFVPHSTRQVFDDDRVRQNALVADGWTVFRITNVMLECDASGTFRPVAVAIEAKLPRNRTRAFEVAQV